MIRIQSQKLSDDNKMKNFPYVFTRSFLSSEVRLKDTNQSAAGSTPGDIFFFFVKIFQI